MWRHFNTNEFYHIYDRGVDKRKLFLDKSDYIRFVHDLYEFNDRNPALEFSRRKDIRGQNVGSRVSHIVPYRTLRIKGLDKGKIGEDRRDVLVRIHAFVLMPNHYHILVEQIKDSGISLFMRKINTGYTRAFNQRYKRNGHLFQGPFKSIHVENDVHLGFLICYLHSNSLDLWRSNWKGIKITEPEIEQALKFLEKYKWSSHLDYLGIKNFSSVVSKDFLLEFFDGIKGYKEFFIDWLRQYKKSIEHIKELIFKK